MLKNKRIAIICHILIVATMVLFLTACGAVENKETPTSPIQNDPTFSETQNTSFVGGMEYVGMSVKTAVGVLEDPDCFYFYRDIVTDVMYVCFEEYRKGGITEMHDPETGLPLTYTRYLELAQNTEAMMP